MPGSASAARRTSRRPAVLRVFIADVSLEDTVTVVRFSQIVDSREGLRDRLHGLGGSRN